MTGSPSRPAQGSLLTKRGFLAAGLGSALVAGLGAPAFAQAERAPPASVDAPHRIARTVPLFRSPDGFPNGLAAGENGLWIAEQKAAGAADPREKAMLVDWNGRLLRTVLTESRNTSGIAFGAGHIWMGANAAPQGFFRTDLESRTLSHRQIPLAPGDNGGGTHGALYREGKLWIVSNRLRGILRVDPESWQPEYMIPFPFARWHDIAWDDGAIWMVTGTSNRIPENQPGLARYDAASGCLLETVTFAPGSADPHGLEMHDGVLYLCDAGIGPGFVATGSPTARFICRVEFV